MNKHKFTVANEISLPKRGASLDNPSGYPIFFKLPAMEDISGKYMNTLYSPNDITIDWNSYKHFLSKVKPDFHFSTLR